MTPRRHEPSQNVTEELSPAQLTALGELLAGRTVTDAAQAAGVARETVHRWLRDGGAFEVGFNRGRADLRDATAAQLLIVARNAAGVVQRAIDEGDVRAALAVLRGMGMLGGDPAAIGPTTQSALTLQRSMDFFSG